MPLAIPQITPAAPIEELEPGTVVLAIEAAEPNQAHSTETSITDVNNIAESEPQVEAIQAQEPVAVSTSESSAEESTIVPSRPLSSRRRRSR